MHPQNDSNEQTNKMKNAQENRNQKNETDTNMHIHK